MRSDMSQSPVINTAGLPSSRSSSFSCLPAHTLHAISQVNFKVHHIETACAGNFYRALNIQRYRVNICFSKFRRFYGNFYISSRNFRRVETFEETIIQMQDFILSVAFGQSLYVYNAAVHIHGIALFFFVANPVNRADLFPVFASTRPSATKVGCKFTAF